MMIKRAASRFSVGEMVRMAAGWGGRRLTARRRTLPDFLIIGGQRCGTTSLYRYLVQHPQVTPAFIKETHFFDRSYQRGIGFYRSFFPLSGVDGKITGEATPYYLFDPHVPARVAENLPEIKLIVLLRNPVDRAYSHFQFESRLGKETLDFSQAVERELAQFEQEEAMIHKNPAYKSDVFSHFSYLARGRYVEQIQRWREHFPDEQFLILQSEEFYKNTDNVLRTVEDFLGVSHSSQFDGKKYNAEKYSSMPAVMRAELENYFLPFNQQLISLLGQEFGWANTGSEI